MAVYSHRTIRTNAIPRTGRLQDSLQGGNTVVITNGNIGSIPTGDFNVAAGDGINITPVVGVENKLLISHKDTSSVGNTGNLDDVFIQNLTFDEFGHVTGIESVRTAAALDDRYLRKDIDDTAHGNITFDQSISSTIYLDGFDGKGWKIENTGLAELDGARIRSDVFLGGKIGSPSFASGFTGWGWEIDTPTASGTVDNWTVRKSFKVYEMIYSQVLGLNGSSMITDFNKIKAVSPLGTGRYHCTMDDVDGEMMMNLRNGDIVRAQKRDGWNIRFYYALVENVTSNSFDLKILSGSDVPEPGDVCFRTGNEKDKNRQGLIYLTSSDDYASYIDILDEIDGPSFEGKTKVRLGNLRGLTVNGQPLDMYGIYINGGIFQHSSYYLDNGNTIEQQFTIMDGKLESSIEAIRNDMSVENGNILRNSGFSTDTNYWTATNNVHFIPIGDGFLWVPSDFYVEKESVADIYRDGSRNVLRIKNCSIRQLNSVLNLPERSQEDTDPKEYSFSFFYRVLRAGTLTAGFSDSDLFVSQVLEPSDNYQKLSKVAQWNEQGDFELSFTGEILIYAVSLFNDALADAVVKLGTRIEQTEEYIKLLATKEYVDKETEKVYKKYDAELKVTAEEISQRVTYEEYQNGIDGVTFSLSSKISTQAGRITAVSKEVDNINNTISEAGWITSTEGNQLYAKKEMENGKTIISTINQTAEAVSIDADKINLNGVVTANKNFQILLDGSMKAVNADLSGKITATSGTIGGFTINSNSLKSSYMTIGQQYTSYRYDNVHINIGNAVSTIPGSESGAIAISTPSSSYAFIVKSGKIGTYKSNHSFAFPGQTVSIRVDNSDTWFNFVNGIFVGAKKVRAIDYNDVTNTIS